MRRAGWLAMLLLIGGCVSRPSGPDTPTMRRIEAATQIIDYPSQRLVILEEIARQVDLLPHEQIYLVNAIFLGGFSSDRADALITLIRNPCCTAEARAQLRQKLKTARMIGHDQRRVIDALSDAESARPRAGDTENR